MAQSFALFLGPLALRDIHHRTHKLDHLARLIADRVGDTGDVSYGTVRKNDAVVVFGIVALVNLSVDQFDRGSIVRMHSFQEAFLGLRCSSWIEAKNLRGFDRPEKSLGADLPSPTSRMAKALRFGEVSLSTLQFAIKLLEPDNHVVEDAAQAGDFVVSRGRHSMTEITSRPSCGAFHQSPERLSDTASDGRAEEGSEQERQYGCYRQNRNNSPLRPPNIQDRMPPLFTYLAANTFNRFGISWIYSRTLDSEPLA